MRDRVLILAIAAVAALFASVPASAQQRPMGIVDLLDVPRISGPRISPDGAQVLYSSSDTDWDGNRRVSHIWRIQADGSDAVQLTNGEDGESSPRWSPDGRTIAFLAQRGDADSTQIYLLNNGGGEGIALSEHPTAVGSISWSHDGNSALASACRARRLADDIDATG